MPELFYNPVFTGHFNAYFNQPIPQRITLDSTRPITALARSIDQHLEDGAEHEKPRLLHGDWSPCHVLTEHHQVTGIIGLESLRGGDPIADLAGWTLEAPQPLTEALLCGYAPQGLSPRDQYALTVYRLRAAIALRRWRLAENDHQKTEQIETQIATDLKALDRSDG